MSKYAELRDHLIALETNRWNATFSEIEKVLGFSLPASARRYPAWWANQTTGAHVQCSSWLDAGWNTSNLNLTTEQITFERTGGVKKELTHNSFKPTRSSLTWEDVLSEDESQPASNLDAGYLWHNLGELHIDHKGRIAFPRVPNGPAIYSFILRQNDDVNFYIGETDQISLRFQHYRTPGVTQRTNQRLNSLMRECLENGGTVSISIIPYASVRIGERTVDIDLADKQQRKLIESAAVVSAKLLGQKLLNK